MNRRLVLGGAVAVALVAMVGVAVAVGAGNQGRADAGTSGFVAGVKQLPSDDPVAARIAALRQKGMTNPAPKTNVNPNVAVGQAATVQQPPLPDGAVPMGGGYIFQGATMSRPPSDTADAFTSGWSAFGAGQNVDVWVGSSASDSAQGIALIVIWNDDRSSITGGGIITAPKATGALTVSSATGLMLTVTSVGGATYTLDPLGQTIK